MTPNVERFIEIVRKLESLRGPFVLFGLFLREDSLGTWDVVASAKWLDGWRIDEMRYITDNITSTLPDDELLTLSRIAPMETESDSVKGIVSKVAGLVLPTTLESFVFAGAGIQTAYIISARLHADITLATMP